jgi:hypothetical protein
VPIVLKSGSLNLLEPSGPVQACNGIVLPFLISHLIIGLVSGPILSLLECRKIVTSQTRESQGTVMPVMAAQWQLVTICLLHIVFYLCSLSRCLWLRPALQCYHFGSYKCLSAVLGLIISVISCQNWIIIVSKWHNWMISVSSWQNWMICVSSWQNWMISVSSRTG